MNAFRQALDAYLAGRSELRAVERELTVSLTHEPHMAAAHGAYVEARLSFVHGNFVATVLLWWSNRRLVTGAEKSAERQLRAYVFVTETKILAADINGTILNPPQNIRVGTRRVRSELP